MRLFSGWSAVVVLLVAFFVWAYGPAIPGSDEELRDAYSGRRVVVCGASYGIGAEIAYGLARAHSRIVLSARSEVHLQEVAVRCRELGAAEVVVHAADLSTRDGCRGLVTAANDALGGIDALILNHIISTYEDWSARIMRGHETGTLEDDLAFVDKMYSVNILSYIYLSSYAMPSLASSSGRIIAVGSMAGKAGMPRVAPYAGTKHSVFGYFDSLRQDLIASPDARLRNISVTTAVLGSYDTEKAREMVSEKLESIVWHPPADAAASIITAGARRSRVVYAPWEQVRLAALLHPLMPSAFDWVIRKLTVPEAS